MSEAAQVSASTAMFAAVESCRTKRADIALLGLRANRDRSVPLHPFAKPFPSGTPHVNLLDSFLARLPKHGTHHPLAHGFLAHANAVFLPQVLFGCTEQMVVQSAT